MCVVGWIVVGVLVEVGKVVVFGVIIDEFDWIVYEYLVDNGVYLLMLGYKGFLKLCCMFFNEVICYGIFDLMVIIDCDIVNIDVIVYIGGVYGDINVMFLVGDVVDEYWLFVDWICEVIMCVINIVKFGWVLFVIGCVIELYVNWFGYNVV